MQKNEGRERPRAAWSRDCREHDAEARNRNSDPLHRKGLGARWRFNLSDRDPRRRARPARVVCAEAYWPDRRARSRYRSRSTLRQLQSHHFASPCENIVASLPVRLTPQFRVGSIRWLGSRYRRCERPRSSQRPFNATSGVWYHRATEYSVTEARKSSSAAAPVAFLSQSLRRLRPPPRRVSTFATGVRRPEAVPSFPGCVPRNCCSPERIRRDLHRCVNVHFCPQRFVEAPHRPPRGDVRCGAGPGQKRPNRGHVYDVSGAAPAHAGQELTGEVECCQEWNSHHRQQFVRARVDDG